MVLAVPRSSKAEEEGGDSFVFVAHEFLAGSVDFGHPFQFATQLGKLPGYLDGAGPGGGKSEFFHPKFPEHFEDLFRFLVGFRKRSRRLLPCFFMSL